MEVDTGNIKGIDLAVVAIYIRTLEGVIGELFLGLNMIVCLTDINSRNLTVAVNIADKADLSVRSRIAGNGDIVVAGHMVFLGNAQGIAAVRDTVDRVSKAVTGTLIGTYRSRRSESER